MPNYQYGGIPCSICAGAVITNLPPYLQSLCQNHCQEYLKSFVPCSEELNEVFREEDAMLLAMMKKRWKQQRTPTN